MFYYIYEMRISEVTIFEVDFTTYVGLTTSIFVVNFTVFFVAYYICGSFYYICGTCYISGNYYICGGNTRSRYEWVVKSGQYEKGRVASQT